MPADFAARYGPWALVAGAAEGLGEAFARQLAGRGLDLVLLDRQAEPLQRLAAELSAAAGAQVRPLVLDLASPDLLQRVQAATDGLELGLLVYNAAHSPAGAFHGQALEQHLRVLDVNCRAPLVLAHLLGGPMRRRGRGGLLLMSSLSGLQGAPRLASYAASKAFNRILAESLWAELRDHGVDVLACIPGAVRTPGFEARARGGGPRGEVLEPSRVAAEALDALGRTPALVPGRLGPLSSLLLSRLLPRRLAIRLMERATRALEQG
jgi:short-subunit dehydrogenase